MSRFFTGRTLADQKLEALTGRQWFNPVLDIDINRLPPNIRDILDAAVIDALPPTATVTLRDELAEAIPAARDGDLITPDYHNALRAAILRLATGQAGRGTQLLSFSPAFFPFTFLGRGRAPEWVPFTGYVQGPPGGDQRYCHGWMPLALPEGYRLARVFVNGGRSLQDNATNGTLEVEVLAQKVSGKSRTTLFESTFTGMGRPAARMELDRKAAVDELVIRGGGTKYLLHASFGVEEGQTAMYELYGFEAECTPVG